ncbi:hypothetical protein RSOLAG22IIIB_10633 [Rhizoctonia solani]|uniref:Uncharacterized protein n=1 Tax=Rhizoctonia solani TaxID=456999 RepID=A0A0K6G3X9_9AGAM|nr:hypothetical protein RSOLAG22IIIB_10633 [Rhizoctonia solani]
MILSGGGRIIGACSVAGKLRRSNLAVPYFGAYCMAKYASTHTLQQLLISIWLKDIISKCEYAPILERKPLETVATHGKSTPERNAGLVIFLASPAAANINGASSNTVLARSGYNKVTGL